MAEDDAKLLARIDERTGHIVEKLETIDKRLDSHAGKIRALELWRNWSTGAAAAIAALLGVKTH